MRRASADFRVGLPRLEAQPERDWDVGGARAVLGEDVVVVRIGGGAGLGVWLGLVVGPDIAGLGEEAFTGEARRLEGEAEAAIRTEGIACVLVDSLIGLVLIAAVVDVAIL